MFREMRRKDRQLSEEAVLELIETEKDGVLSVCGDDGYPYGVPVNYGYQNGKFYIHSTGASSHKLDAIRKNQKVCLTIVGKHEMEAARLTTHYSSVIVFGKARIMNEGEKNEGMHFMMLGLAPEMAAHAKAHCKGADNGFAMIEITPEHVTGKARR